MQYNVVHLVELLAFGAVQRIYTKFLEQMCNCNIMKCFNITQTFAYDCLESNRILRTTRRRATKLLNNTFAELQYSRYGL